MTDRIASILPSADVDALLSMPKAQLWYTLMVCRDVYNEGHTLDVSGNGVPRGKAIDRDAMVREILMLRAQYLRLTWRQRRSLRVYEHPGAPKRLIG